MIFDGKVYREETEEELEQRKRWEDYIAKHPVKPSNEERIAQLEEALNALLERRVQ